MTINLKQVQIKYDFFSYLKHEDVFFFLNQLLFPVCISISSSAPNFCIYSIHWVSSHCTYLPSNSLRKNRTDSQTVSRNRLNSKRPHSVTVAARCLIGGGVDSRTDCKAHLSFLACSNTKVQKTASKYQLNIEVTFLTERCKGNKA